MEPCEIARLPEELLSVALSRTSPRDACRAAVVSPAFRAAADSDAVWSCFLPPLDELPPLTDGEPCRKKDLFLRLSGRHVLLPGGLMSMWLDRETGAKCYMVSARALSIAWRDTPRYWNWVPLADSRWHRVVDSSYPVPNCYDKKNILEIWFSETAVLRLVCWLDIPGKIDSKILSKGSVYAAHIVYKLADSSYGLDSPIQEASIRVGGTNLTRKVCLQPNPQRSMSQNRRAEDVVLPCQRGDGWMELELGEFTCDGDEDGDVSFGVSETKALNGKSGLVVQGIEIRHKKSG